jgi:hypothetical protein
VKLDGGAESGIVLALFRLLRGAGVGRSWEAEVEDGGFGREGTEMYWAPAGA